MADPDVFMKAKCTKEGFEYWSYMFVYVDVCLLIDRGPGPAIEELNKEYRFEERRVQTTRYLGATIDHYSSTDGNTYWSMSSCHYLKEACKTIRRKVDDG